jgi:putative transcriptional regulator
VIALETITTKLREIIDNRGIKQSHIVRKTGINKSTMTRLVNGETAPTLMNAFKIARELDLKIEDIWKVVDKRN